MVDARGLLCPMPVVMVQKAVKDGHPAEIEVLLDDACAVENVTRYANRQGYTVTSAPEGSDTRPADLPGADRGGRGCADDACSPAAERRLRHLRALYGRFPHALMHGHGL